MTRAGSHSYSRILLRKLPESMRSRGRRWGVALVDGGNGCLTSHVFIGDMLSISLRNSWVPPSIVCSICRMHQLDMGKFVRVGHEPKRLNLPVLYLNHQHRNSTLTSALHQRWLSIDLG